MNIPAGASFTYQAQGSLPFSNPAIQGVIDQLNLDIQSSDSVMITNSSAQGSGGIVSNIAQALNPFGSGPEFEITLTCYNASGTDLESISIQQEMDSYLQGITGNPVISSLTGITKGGGTQQLQTTGTTQNAGPNISLPSLGSGSFIIIAIVVVLVAAIVLAPETPARVARSFAA
jgi:hypothetical protein